ncbi:MAG: glucose-6-phosphate isomerase [Ekhidna sp.]
MLPKINPTTTRSWANLADLAKNFDGDIKSLLKNPSRVEKFSFRHEDLHFDFSKSSVSDEVLDQLIELASECLLNDGIEAQYTGKRINETEDRAVLHTALRDFTGKGEHHQLVRSELEKIKKLSDQIHQKKLVGFTGKPFTDIVNIGIGGSDLGPKMVCHALYDHWKGVTPHFISNVDAAQLNEELEGLNPDTTLFIIASKTFTTQETMTNAQSAKDWFLANGGSEGDISKHFVAVSTNVEAVQSFGIDAENVFTFWEWVGGRFSLWSAIGLSIACTIGFREFESLLKGAHDMDKHFRNTPIAKNIPAISALVGIWYNNFLGYDSLAVLPYDHRLRYLPSYLQQADMESNGKSVDRSGNPINYQTGPIIWGEPGTNGQHAFYQLIHQGTKIIPTEFIAFANPSHTLSDHHEKLLANFFAQPEALLTGKSKSEVEKELAGSKDELIPFKVFDGNRPSASILIKELNPFNLGTLIAYYEHRIFVQGHIWNIFSYDQWGVELGKQLAKPILSELKERSDGAHDHSTSSLINVYRSMRK